MLAPNLAVKPSTVLITKVTIKGMRQAAQMFGPAQKAVAKAVADCVAKGTIPADKAEELVIVCGVFIHPAATDDEKIERYNYEATVQAIEAAMAIIASMALPPSASTARPSSTAALCGAQTTPRRCPEV